MKKSLEQMKIASNPISIDDLEEEISKQVIINNIYNIYYLLYYICCFDNELNIGS